MAELEGVDESVIDWDLLPDGDPVTLSVWDAVIDVDAYWLAVAVLDDVSVGVCDAVEDCVGD